MSSHHGEEHAIHVPQPSFSPPILGLGVMLIALDRKSTRLNSSHSQISYAVFCLKKKNNAHFARCLLTLAPLSTSLINYAMRIFATFWCFERSSSSLERDLAPTASTG